MSGAVTKESWRPKASCGQSFPESRVQGGITAMPVLQGWSNSFESAMAMTLPFFFSQMGGFHAILFWFSTIDSNQGSGCKITLRSQGPHLTELPLLFRQWLEPFRDAGLGAGRWNWVGVWVLGKESKLYYLELKAIQWPEGWPAAEMTLKLYYTALLSSWNPGGISLFFLHMGVILQLVSADNNMSQNVESMKQLVLLNESQPKPSTTCTFSSLSWCS